MEISTLIGGTKSTQKRSEEPVAVFTALDKASKKELWKVVKDYASLTALDSVLRPLVDKPDFPRMPEQNLFQTHAPSRVDTRREALIAYFNYFMEIPTLQSAASHALCEFLSTGAIDPMDVPDTPSRREGYLTKRNKKIKGWKVQYFAMEGDHLNYYDKPGAELQGSIYLIGAKIGRQTKTETDSNPSEDALEKEFRHAFLLVEPRKKDCRHVLCAESDDDRDRWIEALLEVIAQPPPSHSPAPALETLATTKKNSSAVSVNSSASTTTYTPSLEPSYKAKNFRHSGSFTSHPNLPDSFRSKPHSDSSISQLRQQGEDDAETLKEKKSKKKSFFSAFRNRASNNHGQSASISAVPEYFQATPYSAVEQKTLPANHAGAVNSNPSKHDVAAIQALGASLEEAIISQKNIPVPSDSPQPFSPELGGKINRVFGVPLADAVDLSSKNVHLCRVPSIVYRCIELLKVRGAIFEEGIFRLSGSTSAIRNLKERFNKEFDVDLVNSETYYDIHAVAGLLKLYLREIPTLILSPSLVSEFRNAVDIPNSKEKTRRLKNLVRELPKENRDLLCVLCSLLTEIISHSDVNRMTLRNVGIVFAPTLNIQASVLINFLTDFDAIFGDEDESTGSSNENLQDSALTPAQAAATISSATVQTKVLEDDQK